MVSEQDVLDIQQRLAGIRAQMASTAAACGRNVAEISLLVVSKAQPVEKMLAAYQAGVRQFGENYPEETQRKIDEIQGIDDIEWHMIGHLQSRKAKIIVSSFAMLHSLDSLSLAEKLNRQLVENQRTLPVLLEMNVGGEDSKGGWDAWDETRWEELYPVVERLQEMQGLHIRGLMAMPPWSENPEDSRPYFQRLRRLRDTLAGRYSTARWDDLSIGTSGDYPVAIQEGATFIRIGTAIMGRRVYANQVG